MMVVNLALQTFISVNCSSSWPISSISLSTIQYFNITEVYHESKSKLINKELKTYNLYDSINKLKYLQIYITDFGFCLFFESLLKYFVLFIVCHFVVDSLWPGLWLCAS